MKIICTNDEKEWIKRVLIASDDCDLACRCKLHYPADIKNTCKRCIEEHITFETEESEE